MYRLLGSNGADGERWTELSEVELFTENGTNVAPSSSVELITAPNSGNASTLTNGIAWPNEGFVLWTPLSVFQ